MLKPFVLFHYVETMTLTSKKEKRKRRLHKILCELHKETLDKNPSCDTMPMEPAFKSYDIDSLESFEIMHCSLII